MTYLMSVTGLVVAVGIIILGIYDLSVVVYGMLTGKKTSYSVSAFLIRAGLESRMIVFAFAFVCGHLFGYMYPDSCPPPSANILAPNFWMVFSGLIAVAYFLLWKNGGASSPQN